MAIHQDLTTNTDALAVHRQGVTGMDAIITTTGTEIMPGGLEPVISMVLGSLDSAHSRRAYRRALTDFTDWYAERGRPGLTKATVQAWRRDLEDAGLAPSTVNQRLSAVRKLATEAADNGLMDPDLAAGVKRVSGVTQRGQRMGNWLSADDAQTLLDAPDTDTLRGLRDRAILATMLGAGLRRSEVARLTFAQLQQREARWVIVDIHGKGGRTRSVPIAPWTKQAIDAWADAADLETGRVFRSIDRWKPEVSGDSITPQALRDVVKRYTVSLAETAQETARQRMWTNLAPHDLRRTYAQLARAGGTALEQLSVNLGHASLKTTERYLGVELDLHEAPADHLPLRVA